MDSKDLQEIARIFDSIISSPSDAVQSAFKNLVVLASLSQPNEETVKGPFESMMSRVENLEHQMRELRREVQINNNTDSYTYKIDDIQVVDLSNMGSITLTGAQGTSPSSYAWSDETIQISNFDIKIK
jgi:hypothetical protein